MRFELDSWAYAHRGLWGGSVPENSLAAFEAAAKAGLGCELDVRPSQDGALMVFHDATLERMCGDSRRLDAVDVAELPKLPDGSPIPRLAECLTAMDGRPALIELKVDAPGGHLADRVANAISGIDAPCAVMSFDEATVVRLRSLVTDRPVGLLIDTQTSLTAAGVLAKAARGGEIGCGYIAPHLSSLATAWAAGMRLPLIAWTARTQIDLDVAKRFGAAPIFEGVSPALAKSGGTPI